MLNWKIAIGLSLFMISGIEFLKIKDNYHPDRITPSLVLLIGGFILSIAIATGLVAKGLRRNTFR